MAEPDYKLISSVLLGQLRMIANETTFDSLEEVREFAKQCELVPKLLPYQMIALKDLYESPRHRTSDPQRIAEVAAGRSETVPSDRGRTGKGHS